MYFFTYTNVNEPYTLTQNVIFFTYTDVNGPYIYTYT